ncbi:hypothetical protein FH972_024146 [Carpinus fangiana]|uniref:Altered inheritance of mitochondria protein 9, mitochondrial n=1 Tax=Carpinus fangiana TaxID=176857 RepID=A0A5N6KX66_9ROSI|nr:hypothetical protein FH972_024146 [Carpinus fangiana]
MKPVPGVQLQGRWESMNTHQHMLCVKALTQLTREMCQLQFPAYGSIYFNDAPIPEASKIDLGNGFCLGPYCGTPAWPCHPINLQSCQANLSTVESTRDLESYCSYLISVGLAKLPSRDPPVNQTFWGSVEEHKEILDHAAKVMNALMQSPEIQSIAAPMLFHPDLNKRNIYVDDNDPTKITALIDWQAACIEPTFAFADEDPDFVTMPQRAPSLSMEDTENNEIKIINQDVDICRQTFEVGVRGWLPTFHKARAADRILLNIFRYSSSSWRNSIIPLRQELVDLSHRWSALGLSGTCPYQPSGELIRKQEKALKEFRAAQQLKDFVVRATNSNPDGWVDADSWQAAMDVNKALFEEWLQSVEREDTPSKTMAKAKLLWPFDVDP